MHDKHLLMNLQERFEKGGYVLIAPKSGHVYAYGSNIEKMFNKIVDCDNSLFEIKKGGVKMRNMQKVKPVAVKDKGVNQLLFNWVNRSG